MIYELVPRFRALFQGLDSAHGTGRGEWVKRPASAQDWCRHLEGEGPGLGIAPLMPDSTVKFAAIDLDEPDFEAAFEMQEYIPGASFVERSRSGNAHVWVFFKDPIEAWVPMGILKEAYLAAGKKHVEVFPKNPDFARVKLGNYINLPYHGRERPILYVQDEQFVARDLENWMDEAEDTLNDPKEWHKKARWLLLAPPSARERNAEFGTQKNLHRCAEYILSGDAGVIHHGHQNAVLFMLSKCLTNWEAVDHDDALEMLRAAVKDLFNPIPPDSEVQRILTNVERGEYTSTGCDDPLVEPFTDPSCPIAHPRSF